MERRHLITLNGKYKLCRQSAHKSFIGMSLYKPVLQEFVDLFYDCVSASNLIGIYPQTCQLWKSQLMLSVGPLRDLKTHGMQKKGRKELGMERKQKV